MTLLEHTVEREGKTAAHEWGKESACAAVEVCCALKRVCSGDKVNVLNVDIHCICVAILKL